MKKFIIIIVFLFVSFSLFAQSSKKDSTTTQDAVITINISKINRGIGKVVGFISNEIGQFKRETEENLTPEEKENIRKAKKEVKENITYELRYIRDAIHQGYVTGLRGEEYTPPYKHK